MMKNMLVLNWMRMLFIVFTVLVASEGNAQQDKERLKELREAQSYLSDASEELENENFTIAEAKYRKAISINGEDETAQYNFGNAYYNSERNAEAMRRYKEAVNASEDKSAKHKAFHNLGNTFMNQKDYQNAVEAYKNALRNNPTDDETRYNLALAKDMLEKNPPQGGDGDDKNEDKKENEDENKQENEDKKDDEGNEKEGDEGEDQEDKDKGDEKDENKEGDDQNDQGKPDEPKDKKEGEKPQQQKPTPGQLSPQQIKNLLEAMNNEEKKVQDKINAKKQKGAKVKSNKDW